MAKPRNTQGLRNLTTTLSSKSAGPLTTEHHPALQVEVAPSFLYRIFSTALHVIAAWAVTVSDIPTAAKMAMIGLIVVSLLYSLYSEWKGYLVTWHSSGLVEFSPLQDSGIRTPSNEIRYGQLTRSSFHSYLLVILVVRLDNGSLHRSVIPRDSVSVASYRRIRARLQLLSPDQLVR